MWLDDFRRRTAWNAYANQRRYDAPADPWRYVYIDPNLVEYSLTVSLKWGLGRVQAGEWDLREHCRLIDERSFHKGLFQRFEEDREWTNTTYYETVIDKIRENGHYRGCKNPTELADNYLPTLDYLYEDMRENGYRPNRGVVYETPEDADYIHDLEPMILIGRDGDILWSEGYHRLAIAQLLNIDNIPIYVIQRHEEWVIIRNRISNAKEVPSELTSYADHPDLQDLSLPDTDIAR